MYTANFVKKIPNYYRRFGFLSGGDLLLRIERQLPQHSEDRRRYSIPGFASPVWLREQVSDHAMFWQCIVDEQYDFRRFPHATRLLHRIRNLSADKPPLLIDCGANIGMASIWFASVFNTMEIIAIEPQTQNFDLLCTNTVGFGARIRPLHGAVWYKDGEVAIRNPQAGSAAFQVSDDVQDTVTKVKAHTIPEIIALADRHGPTIVKLDIEGAQKQLFRDQTDWVGDCSLIMLELDDWLLPWQGTSRPFFQVLSQYPFEYLMRGEVLFCFRDFDA